MGAIVARELVRLGTQARGLLPSASFACLPSTLVGRQGPGRLLNTLPAGRNPLLWLSRKPSFLRRSGRLLTGELNDSAFTPFRPMGPGAPTDGAKPELVVMLVSWLTNGWLSALPPSELTLTPRSFLRGWASGSFPVFMPPLFPMLMLRRRRPRLCRRSLRLTV